MPSLLDQNSEETAQNATAGGKGNHSAGPELPLTVKDAARFLGVSVQTVYLWVERKQIPHLRVMGRNIRFLESDHAVAPAGRCPGLQEVLADEAADEARGAVEDESSGQRAGEEF